MQKSKIKTTGHPKIKVNIDHVAKLANLELSVAEKKKFSGQLLEILEYVAKLAKVDTKNVSPMTHASGFSNMMRQDVTEPSLSQEKALKNTKNVHKGFVKINAIFEEL